LTGHAGTVRRINRVGSERCGDGVLQADPGVAPGLDIRSVGTLAHQRVAAHDDAVYRPRLRRETRAQYETGVDYGEQHDPAWIGFVGVVQHFPALAEAVGDTRRIGRIARHRREPIAPFDRALGSAKPALCEQIGGAPG
jgi:hypothetical protein